MTARQTEPFEHVLGQVLDFATTNGLGAADVAYLDEMLRALRTDIRAAKAKFESLFAPLRVRVENLVKRIAGERGEEFEGFLDGQVDEEFLERLWGAERRFLSYPQRHSQFLAYADEVRDVIMNKAFACLPEHFPVLQVIGKLVRRDFEIEGGEDELPDIKDLCQWLVFLCTL